MVNLQLNLSRAKVHCTKLLLSPIAHLINNIFTRISQINIFSLCVSSAVLDEADLRYYYNLRTGGR